MALTKTLLSLAATLSQAFNSLTTTPPLTRKREWGVSHHSPELPLSWQPCPRARASLFPFFIVFDYLKPSSTLPWPCSPEQVPIAAALACHSPRAAWGWHVAWWGAASRGVQVCGVGCWCQSGCVCRCGVAEACERWQRHASARAGV